MKITNWKVWKQNLKLTKPYSIANHTFESVENLFVEIELENGIKALGSGSPSKFVCNEDINDSLQAIQLNGDLLLLNQDIRHFVGILDQLPQKLLKFPAAMACLDIALHDAFTKYLGIRVVDLYGQHHQKLPTSITLGIMDLESSKEEVLDFYRRGFKVIKVKIGENVDKDAELCHRIHEWTQGEMTMRVDGNQGYAPDTLKQFIEKTKALHIEFVEQPLPCNQLGMVRSLPESLRSQIMADEDLHGPEDVPALLSPAPLPYHYFNIKLMKCGGIHRGRQIARMAASQNIPLMWGCMDESVISIGAALHIAFASPNTRYLDLDGHLDLSEDLVKAGFRIEDGYMFLKDRPGLGYTLHE